MLLGAYNPAPWLPVGALSRLAEAALGAADDEGIVDGPDSPALAEIDACWESRSEYCILI